MNEEASNIAGVGGARSAQMPWLNGRPPHLPCRVGEIASKALLPGDPGRVDIAASALSNVTTHGQRREFRAATGTSISGDRVTVCSTGIGGPSTEIAVVELGMLGVGCAIRVGGTGALTADLPLGSFLIVERAIGGTGSAMTYGAQKEGVYADRTVVAALMDAADRAGVPYRLGTVVTTDSYYLAQGRAIRLDGVSPVLGLVERAVKDGASGFDMETETLFAVGNMLGMQTGSILAVHGNRATDTWLEDYEPVQRKLIDVACDALNHLK